MNDGRFLSFEGLNNLKTIKGDFELKSNTAFNKITSFEGLNSLQVIGGSFKLTAISSTVHEASSFNALESFEGLNNLEYIGGGMELTSAIIEQARVSASFKCLKSFRGLNKLASIGGDLILSCKTHPTEGYTSSSTSFRALQSCEGLNHLESIGGSLIFEAGSFTEFGSFNGLENLKTIGKNIRIKMEKLRPSLSNIDAFNSLQQVNGEEISITDCVILEDFTPLQNILQTFNGTFITEGNGYNPSKEQILNGQGKPQK